MFRDHTCTELCLYSIEHAVNAGCSSFHLIQESSLAIKKNSLATAGRRLKRKASDERLTMSDRNACQVPRRKQNAQEKRDTAAKIDAGRARAAATSWPRCLDTVTKQTIMREMYHATSENALKRIPCSFCGTNDLVSATKLFAADSFDFSLLTEAVETLREELKQPAIQVCLEPVDGSYRVCHHCRPAITFKKFNEIPPFGFANACWVGTLPPELEGLT